MRVETNFIHFCMFLIVINFAQTYLVIKDVVEDFLQKSKTWFKNNIWKLCTAKYSLLHFFQLDVLEPKNFLSIMVGDGGTLHLTNFHLHDILKESTSN